MANITNSSCITKFQTTAAAHLLALDNAALLELPRRLFFSIFRILGVFANSLAILVCYVYLKNYRHHSRILVEGYIALFRIFAEFIGAAVCICYGMLELDPHYIMVGTVGILAGLCFKGLVLYFHTFGPPKSRFGLRIATLMYMGCIILCCFDFYDILQMIGAFSCGSRILTCVLPLVALADGLKDMQDTLFFLGTECVALCFIWWYCSHLSFKYFVVVPSIIGLIFSSIQYALEGIHNAVRERNSGEDPEIIKSS